MRTKSQARLVIAALALAVAAAGCSQKAASQPVATSHAQLVENAKGEGSVTIYSTNSPDALKALAEKFKAKYGITVDTLRGPTGTLLQRYESERDAKAPNADLLDIGEISPFTQKAQNFVDIKGKPLESLAAWPDKFIKGDRVVEIGLRPIAMLYNTNMVSKSQVPQTWKAFVQDDVKSKVALPNFGGSITYTMVLKFLQDTYGAGLLADLAKKSKVVYDSGVPLAQAVAAGEQSLGLGFPGFITELKKSGAPIDYFIPEVTTYATNCIGVPTNAPHPNAALLFLDYLMSPEGQSIYLAGTGTSPLQGVDGGLPLSDKAVAPDEEGATKDRAELLKAAGVQGKS